MASLTDEQFRSFLNLMMCSDPWPCTEDDHNYLLGLAAEESKIRGFDDWIVAYHEFQKTP